MRLDGDGDGDACHPLRTPWGRAAFGGGAGCQQGVVIGVPCPTGDSRGAQGRRDTLGCQGRDTACSLLLARPHPVAFGDVGQGLLQVLGDGGGEGGVPPKGAVPGADAGDALEERDAGTPVSRGCCPRGQGGLGVLTGTLRACSSQKLQGCSVW